MLKKILNEAWITFKIKATGPILIKAGETDEETEQRQIREPNTPKMVFVVGANKEIFIPGSSIKGVWRSWCEKIARTISTEVPPLSCDPLCDNEKSEYFSCSKRFEELNKKKRAFNEYALSCPVCKIFGNTSLGSRIKFSDALLSDEGSRDRLNLPKRDGISIDRFTGGVKFLFNYQYVLDREFTTKIQIRNFELWQLGMLAFLIRDFEDQLVPIGYGKTRGLGKVKGTIELITITYYGLKKPLIDINNSIATITGVGELFDDPDNKEGYNFENESSIEGIKFANCNPGIIKTQIELNKDQSKILMNRSAPYWVKIKNEKPDGYSIKSQSIRKGLLEKCIVKGEDASNRIQV